MPDLSLVVLPLQLCNKRQCTFQDFCFFIIITFWTAVFVLFCIERKDLIICASVKPGSNKAFRHRLKIVCIREHMHTLTHTCMHKCTLTQTHTNMHTNMHACTYTQVHTHTYHSSLRLLNGLRWKQLALTFNRPFNQHTDDGTYSFSPFSPSCSSSSFSAPMGLRVIGLNRL